MRNAYMPNLQSSLNEVETHPFYFYYPAKLYIYNNSYTRTIIKNIMKKKL